MPVPVFARGVKAIAGIRAIVGTSNEAIQKMSKSLDSWIASLTLAKTIKKF